jgi:hypothetical protein
MSNIKLNSYGFYNYDTGFRTNRPVLQICELIKNLSRLCNLYFVIIYLAARNPEGGGTDLALAVIISSSVESYPLELSEMK